MKRLDMIQKIIEEIQLMRGVETIINNQSETESFYVYPEDKVIAERILNIIEVNGMIPPPNTINNSKLGSPCEWEYDGSNHE